MTATFIHSWFMTKRHLMNLFRQPAWIFISLVQPIVWLLLYGALFRRIVEIPGFGSGSYIDFLTPGIVVMTALFSAGWSGMGLIEDIGRGIIDRFLVSPVRRGSLIWGRLMQGGLVAVVQSAIILILALLVGAAYPGGFLGIVVLVVVSVLLGTGIGALSNAIALLSRREETMIAASNFILLPLTFLSSVFMARPLMPGWMQAIARYNPVDWAVTAGRGALEANPNWFSVWPRMLALLVFLLICAWLAARAFRLYQRSI
ncbi:MAG: ABC transporter permease [Actinobacteria bacterium]|nr:ABC transporter permease [Actinomycetota bacterium]